jgi:inosine/xanthosine triphosphatase
MKSIVIASKNPVKAQATMQGFKRMFPEESFRLISVSVPPGVRRQPSSDDETLQGATTRARNAANEIVNADYWVGIEGGITEQDGDMAAFAWVVVLSEDQVGKSRTGTFFLPRDVADLVRGGKELGEADDIVFGQINSKQESGAIGLLTRDIVDRTGLYEHAVLLALVPFKNPELYNR